MSITDELRSFARDTGFELTLAPIVDRIDKEHKKAIHELNALAEAIVLPPKDADEVPICIGDKVTEHEDGHTFKVDGFMDWGGEWWVFMRDGVQAPASRCTHYHAPTTEDVLRELLHEVGDGGVYAEDVLVAKYAKRLQLKEVDG